MGGEMRGHTNNRLLRACLKGMILRNREEIARRPKDEADYFQGHIDAVEQIAIFMGLELGMEESKNASEEDKIGRKEASSLALRQVYGAPQS